MPSTAPMGPLNTAHILVCDHEPLARRQLRNALVAVGYDVTEAETGEAALRLSTAVRFEVVLLDLDIDTPGGGFDVCRAMRPGFDAAIFALGDRQSQKDRISALEAGADSFVPRPFNLPELFARVRAAIRRVRRTSEALRQRIAVGGMAIDLGAHMVTTGGQPIHLTPKECELLRFFLSRPNEPITHGELLGAVWGPERKEEKEHLRVFIRQLRRKLEPEPAAPRYILTEPTVGYRFRL